MFGLNTFVILWAGLTIASGESMKRIQCDSIVDSFVAHQVVPEIIPIAPQALLKIKFASGVEVSEGNELTPTQVKDEPLVEWNGDKNSYYTLCMTDPDVPGRANPTLREFQHWLVANIPGSELNKGDILGEYVAIGPPKGTGFHRYIFLLYKQPGKINFDEPRLNNTSAAHRAHFSVVKFAKKYSLGEPLAGNYYIGRYDDYSPVVHKQLGLDVEALLKM